MIFLTKPMIIFLKPRKVAGTSFEISLSQFASQDSIITPITKSDELIRAKLGFRGPQNYEIELKDLVNQPQSIFKYFFGASKPKKFYNHMPAIEIRKKLGEALWANSLKISIVRNPFDMVISRYFWMNPDRKHTWSPDDFTNWCQNNSKNFRNNQDQYLIDNKNIIDFYIRYEQIEKDITELESMRPELIGLNKTFINLSSKSNARPREATASHIFSLSPEAKNIVSECCYFEINKFNYQCPIL